MQEIEFFAFQSYCDDNGIEYVTRAGNLSRGWLLAMDCPFCNKRGKNHLGIPPDGNRGYCWSCGGHSLYNLVAQLTPHIPYTVLLSKYAGIKDMRERIRVVEKPTTISFPYKELGRGAIKYLLQRKFDPDTMQGIWGMRDGGMFDDFSYRIVIPFTNNGSLVTYQGRSYTGIEPKYKFLSDEKSVVSPKHMLYNMDRCTRDTVIVTEGVFDCIRLAGEDASDVCATCGITVHEEQISLLSKYKTVYICYDNEFAAKDRARKLARKLGSIGCKVFVVDTEKPYDLGATSDEEAKELKQEILDNS